MATYTSKEVVVVIRDYQYNDFGPGIPKDAFLPGEVEILESLGFESEPQTQNTLYFFSSNGRNDIDFAMLEEADLALVSVAAANGAAWAQSHLLEKDQEITVIEILHEILTRPQCADISAISITGSYLSNKMTPDGFGGFIDYITRDGVRSDNTRRMLLQLVEDHQNAAGQRKGPRP